MAPSAFSAAGSTAQSSQRWKEEVESRYSYIAAVRERVPALQLSSMSGLQLSSGSDSHRGPDSRRCSGELSADSSRSRVRVVPTYKPSSHAYGSFLAEAEKVTLSMASEPPLSVRLPKVPTTRCMHRDAPQAAAVTCNATVTYGTRAGFSAHYADTAAHMNYLRNKSFDSNTAPNR
mmetsp:Transcript_50369/g.129723  ORF Transcript_50369/g.129723 Transcript_50369/m.129723 type:complete len:176 (+) Transcript_50369:139-666(+)